MGVPSDALLGLMVFGFWIVLRLILVRGTLRSLFLFMLGCSVLAFALLDVARSAVLCHAFRLPFVSMFERVCVAVTFATTYHLHSRCVAVYLFAVAITGFYDAVVLRLRLALRSLQFVLDCLILPLVGFCSACVVMDLLIPLR